MEASSLTSQRQITNFDGTNDQNGINRLPDALLCHTLSFLPIKYAVSTSVLSRRWRYIWTSLPDLCFDDSFSRQSRWYSFVDRVFLLRTSCIKKFVLKCVRSDHDAFRVNSWVCAAMLRNVEEIDLHLSESFNQVPVYLPINLFANQKLSVLKLHGQIRLPSSPHVSLPNLKVCHFKSLRFLTNDCVGVMLSGCPMLEEFVLYTIRNQANLNQLEIRSSSLKSLSVHRTHFVDPGNGGRALVIDTPTLEFLDLKDYGSEKFEVSGFPLLAKAIIDVKRPDQSIINPDAYKVIVSHLMVQVAEVKDLCLSVNTNNALCVLDTFQQAFVFRNLTHLSIRGGDIETPLFSLLLESSPVLEVVVLDKLRYSGWHSGSFAAEHSLSSLKVIKFLKFTASPFEMKLVEFCLKEATSLKEVTIHLDNASGLGSEKMLRISLDILTFTRSSKECKVFFIQK